MKWALRQELLSVGAIFSEDYQEQIKDTTGLIAIFTFGTGNPFFTTDTAAALRAIQIRAEILLKGTRVDGVYSADPEKDPKAVKFTEITFENVLERKLQVMDLTSITLCRENNLPIMVFNMNRTGNLKRIVTGAKIGTIV